MHARAPLPIVLALWVAGLCAAAQYAKISLILPELAVVYPEAGVALGWLVSTLSVVGVLFGLVAGLMAMRLGLRRMLLGGLALGALLSLMQALLPPWPVMLISRVLEGASHLAIVVAAPTLIATLSTQRMRAAGMTLWGTFFGISFALTAWFGLPLVAAHGPAALLLAHAATMAGAALLIATLLPDTTSVQSDALRREEAARHGLYERHLQAWGSPFVAAPAILWLFYTLTFVALLAVLPGLVAIGQRTFAATAMPLASIVCSLTIGVLLLRRLNAVRVVGIGFALAIAAAAVLAWTSTGVVSGIALFAALGLVQGATFASIPELNPTASDQALANGALAQAGNLGNALGTPLLVALQAGRGTTAVAGTVIVCYLAALSAMAWLAARRRARAPHTAR